MSNKRDVTSYKYTYRGHYGRHTGNIDDIGHIMAERLVPAVIRDQVSVYSQTTKLI